MRSGTRPICGRHPLPDQTPCAERAHTPTPARGYQVTPPHCIRYPAVRLQYQGEEYVPEDMDLGY